MLQVMMDFWDFFFATVYYFYFGFIALCVIVPIGFLWFWKRKVPKPARTLFWCAIRGYAPLLLIHDSGRGDIIGIKEKRAEGIVETTAKTFKILPRFAPILSEDMERQLLKEDPSLKDRLDALKDSIAHVKIGAYKFMLDMSHWMAKRTWLLGMPTPLFIGYTGSLCLLNPEALALYEAGDLVIETAERELFNPKGIKGKTKENAMKPLILLDPRKIGKFIYSHFDTSQIAGVIQAAEERARIGMGLPLKKLGIVMIVIIIAIVIILAASYLPQLMQGIGV